MSVSFSTRNKTAHFSALCLKPKGLKGSVETQNRNDEKTSLNSYLRWSQTVNSRGRSTCHTGTNRFNLQIFPLFKYISIYLCFHFFSSLIVCVFFLINALGFFEIFTISGQRCYNSSRRDNLEQLFQSSWSSRNIIPINI